MSEKSEISRLTFNSYANVIDSLRKESLPPWSEASSGERCCIIVLEFAIYLPVLVVLFLTVSIYLTYLLLYIIPHLSPSHNLFNISYYPSDSELSPSSSSAWICFGIITWSVIWLIVSMYKAWSTEPGCIPEDSEWLIYNEDITTEISPLTALERKRDGNKRVCSWCNKKKPDRCHHCRLCNRCVLKMDHHCPWINNCIGFFNYKYFFLTVFYAVACLVVFQTTFWETVITVLRFKRDESILCYYVVFVYSITGLLCIAIAGFFLFHLYLTLNQMTTIEFCEKKRADAMPYPIYKSKVKENLIQALGKRWYLWLLPFSYRDPDEKGLIYEISRA